VHEVYDLFAEFPVTITAELFLPVQLCLLGSAGASLESLRFIHSHPKALEQCSRLFLEHPHFFPQIHQDTAAAAREAAEQRDPAVGAIASREAAFLYHLEVIADGIQNHPDNTTRFVAFTQPPSAGTKLAQKASFTLVLSHRPGALVECLRAFSSRGLNLTKLESRPVSGKPYQYAFFIDCVSDAPTDFVQLTESLRLVSENIRVLGVYEPGKLET
jgi:prephenate dehydratase